MIRVIRIPVLWHVYMIRVYDTCDWRAVQLDYVKEVVDYFVSEFDLKIALESMESPREYNFTTDRIFVTIDEDEVKRLFFETKPETLDALAKERFTSRSGFISSYSNDIDNWPEDITEWDHNQVGTLVEAYLRDKEYDEEKLVLNIMEDGGCENYIANHTPGIERLFKISDYLRNRENR